MKDYENITLEELDTSNFFVDLHKPNHVALLHKIHKDFAFERTTVSNACAMRYIALMYDPQSELRTNIPYYPIRKRIAAKVAGFKLDKFGKFEKDVEDALVGQNKYINKAIIQYCFLTLNIYFVAHPAYLDMSFKALSDSFGNYDKDIRGALEDLQKKVLAHESKIFGGDEVNELRKALYLQSKKIELDFTPEAVVKKIESGEDLSDFSPYPKEYIPNKLKYAGSDLTKTI